MLDIFRLLAVRYLLIFHSRALHMPILMTQRDTPRRFAPNADLFTRFGRAFVAARFDAFFDSRVQLKVAMRLSSPPAAVTIRRFILF